MPCKIDSHCRSQIKRIQIMTQCGHCGTHIIQDPKKAWFFAADSRVCSKTCQHARIRAVTISDPKLECPGQWHSRVPIPTKPPCGFCSKPGAEHHCQWCRDDDAVPYCSIKCQHQHWVSGHAMVCWRFGRTQPTPMQPTPSFIDALKDISGSVLGCVNWFR